MREAYDYQDERLEQAMHTSLILLENTSSIHILPLGVSISSIIPKRVHPIFTGSNTVLGLPRQWSEVSERHISKTVSKAYRNASAGHQESLSREELCSSLMCSRYLRSRIFQELGPSCVQMSFNTAFRTRLSRTNGDARMMKENAEADGFLVLVYELFEGNPALATQWLLRLVQPIICAAFAASYEPLLPTKLRHHELLPHIPAFGEGLDSNGDISVASYEETFRPLFGGKVNMHKPIRTRQRAFSDSSCDSEL